jgi:putative ABC transport system substrate-binding protein
MRKNVVPLALCAMLYALCYSVWAQQPAKVPRIGFLITSSPSAIAPRIEAFRQGLRELGYVEGKTIVIERRYAEGKVDRLSALAAEFVSLRWTSSSVAGQPQPVPLKAQLLRFRLS